jgi:glutathionylspermidine synthase
VQRRRLEPRPDWVDIVTEQGLVYCWTERPDGTLQPYWDESVYYAFTLAEVEGLEKTAAELWELCIAAGDYMLDNGWLERIGVPLLAHDLVRRSWQSEPPSIYGRFDFRYDGVGPAKLLEFNADTPTSLLEASAIQWLWLEDRFPEADQWNSLHDRLVAKWRDIAGTWKPDGPLHICWTDAEQSGEDLMNVGYLAETARQAGLDVVLLPIEELGWDYAAERFVDLEDQPVRMLFKLYPWEWTLDDPFGPMALETLWIDPVYQPDPHHGRGTIWVEPIWKVLWSNKALLAALWEIAPGHPNLLPAYLDGPHDLVDFATKPLLGREGANVTLVQGDHVLAAGPDQEYGAEGFVHQGLATLPDFGGSHPVLGVWLVDGQPAGLGVRESESLITNNLSRFVPHLIEPEA